MLFFEKVIVLLDKNGNFTTCGQPLINVHAHLTHMKSVIIDLKIKIDSTFIRKKMGSQEFMATLIIGNKISILYIKIKTE